MGRCWTRSGIRAERRQERTLIAQYIGDLQAMVVDLTIGNMNTAVALAELPDQIRGFGPVKDANRVKAEESRDAVAGDVGTLGGLSVGGRSSGLAGHASLLA